MTYPPGQPLRLSIEVLDNTPGSLTFGKAQDPGDIALRLRGPNDQTTSTFTFSAGQIVRDSQGNFHFDLTPNEPGPWRYRWVATPPFGAATSLADFEVETSSIG